MSTSTHYAQLLTFTYMFILNIVNTYFLVSHIYWAFVPSLYHPNVDTVICFILVLYLKPSVFLGPLRSETLHSARFHVLNLYVIRTGDIMYLYL